MAAYPAPNSVLVMDNAAIHKGGKIRRMARRKGTYLFASLSRQLSFADFI